MEESEYALHINIGEIEAEIGKVQAVNKELSDKVTTFFLRLKKTTNRIEPILRRETNTERELWEEYKQLQREK